MGVPALFRWLSKKYPKIVLPVVEEEETTVTDDAGDEIVKPVDYTSPNPNGEEFDNLYLDMNGIVHPCTHPEGKPAPETEEEMMVEVFKYTERVVNMVRPRKLLMMAIDGVAPRAKMNQQRSRRFRASQEAKEKEEARKESLMLWESMGKTITDDMRNKKSWDSNAITPGTPFMDLLAQSLRYWVVRKMNTDPGWKQLEVIISDASVPGEGEHKIMDFIRRQRSNPGHDPNTRHVIYGLDADLIMLSLATHEPHFRVLREDVFFQDTSPTACRICGQEGHYAAQCTGEKKEKFDELDTKKAPTTKKPFIFLDVAILREYLEVELNVPNVPFHFDFERAIDDWVLLIFFVGNDFLPHLPSLEIREGAIDELLKIWKVELPRMGGYITNHGKLEYDRAQIILEGLAKLEDRIFVRRREAEERQDRNTKRRRLEAGDLMPMTSVPPAPAPPLVTGPHGLPPRPNFTTFEENANLLGLGIKTQQESANGRMAALAEAADKGRQIRDANLSAAEMLKAELMAPIPANPVARKKYMAQKAAAMKVDTVAKSDASPPTESTPVEPPPAEPQLPQPTVTEEAVPTADEQPIAGSSPEANRLEEQVKTPDTPIANGDSSPLGVKRKAEDLDAEGEDDEDFDLGPDDDEEVEPEDISTLLARKVNPDGTVEQEDRVKLFEPGYRERYYKQKFGVEFSDVEFRKKITTAYIEGMAWVLQYYYQGAPSWTWYYPYHFAPFAQDFEEVSKMKIEFNKGQPFRPFEQLMGVFPAASRKHIPEVFHALMTDEDSPIKDFYPETFEIDMNGKKMAWQGVALLPFIDEKRLLEAMATRYPGLTEEEIKRNTWGSNVLYVADEHPLYPVLESLYAKRKDDNPVPIDPGQSRGLNGSLLPDPTCVPGSTYFSPLTSQGLDDIAGDCSLAAIYFFPKQLTPHRSVLLPGARRPQRVLAQGDLDDVRHGRRGGRPQRAAGFHDINSGREGGYGIPRNGSFGGQSQSSYGGYGGDGRNGRNNYGDGYSSGRGSYGGYGNGGSQYSNRSVPPPRDYSRPSYGVPPPRATYQAPVTEYNRQNNQYDYRGGRGRGGANGYSRPPPPPPPSTYGSSQSGGRYGSGTGGYGGYGQSGQASSYSQNYNSGTGYGGNSRGNYGGYGDSNGRGNYGGYGSDRGGSSASHGSYGYGQSREVGPAGQYDYQGGYGGYGRGGPSNGSYNGRGRGYSRY